MMESEIGMTCFENGGRASSQIHRRPLETGKGKGMGSSLELLGGTSAAETLPSGLGN